MKRTSYGWEFIGRVLESRALTPSAHGIVVERPKEFEFRPVQFTFLSLKTAESQDWQDFRPMSLASSPTRPHLEYGVRLGESPWKRAFAGLKAGDEVMVEGPAGHFVLDSSRPAVFVVGGIGVTPIKGMIEYATDLAAPVPLRLLAGNRSTEEIPYREELEALARRNPLLRITNAISRGDPGPSGVRGRIDAKLLAQVAEGLEAPVYYVCGGPEFVDSVTNVLYSGLGATGPDIRAEQFRGY
ncbi:MAG TPA: hypothetical protein VJQ43_00895 [Thermoplasmata archaeon]|nr:hypothetical protein [Thermoplasmata archaeon]